MIFPKKGDIVIIDAEPHSGMEYGGHNSQLGNIRRHLMVVSSGEYNQSTKMILAMPITTSERYRNNPRYYPILISGGKSGVKGYVVLWQLQNFDFVSRNGKIVNKISNKQYNDLLPYIKRICWIFSGYILLTIRMYLHIKFKSAITFLKIQKRYFFWISFTYWLVKTKSKQEFGVVEPTPGHLR